MDLVSNPDKTMVMATMQPVSKDGEPKIEETPFAGMANCSDFLVHKEDHTIGNLLVFTTAILVVTSRFDVNPSISGLVLSYILSVVQMLQFTVRQLAEVENGMNAVERIEYYGKRLEEEAPEHTVEVPAAWPEKGEITFDGVEMRYRAGLPLVLRGLDMRVALCPPRPLVYALRVLRRQIQEPVRGNVSV